jgi:hypothetical protein
VEHLKATGLATRSGERKPQEAEQPEKLALSESTKTKSTGRSTARPMSREEAEAWKIHGYGLNECELALEECSRLVCEPSIYNELFALGIYGPAAAVVGGGPFSALRVEAVVVDQAGLFQFAKHRHDATGAVRAIIFAARNTLGEIVDVAAWQPGSGEVALWQGNVAALGEDNIPAPRIDPLSVCETPAEWFRAGRTGVFIIDDQRAAASLEGDTLAVGNPRFGRLLRSRLAPFMTTPPRIVVPQETACG